MRRIGWGVAVAGLAGALGIGGPIPVTAQVAPSLEVAPLRVDPEEVVAFTVRDCAAAPEVSVGESDFIQMLVFQAGPADGTWTSELPAGLTDWTVAGSCGGVAFDDVVVDIDNPLMSFLPIGTFAPAPDVPSTVYGSDCPDDTAAEVTFTFGADRHASVTSTVPVDERGDWQAAVPADAGPLSRVPVPGPQTNTVSASCGAVTYADLTYTVEIEGPATPPVVDRPEASPPPARPVPGRPSFAG